MKPIWFKPRGYRHLDAPVGLSYAGNAERPDFVASHSFLPLLHYVKETKRYRPPPKEKPGAKGKTDVKKRDIMYASHRDACILARYAHELGEELDAHYSATGLSDCVIAYRKLAKANYDFSADVLEFARTQTPCTILCFDVSDFFGSLDHRLLKGRLKRILGVTELPIDWYNVYRHTTRFTYINVDELNNHPNFSERMNRRRAPLATITEVIAAGIPLHSNKKDSGIPQGTPISSAFSNLYMTDFDAVLQAYCAARGALYRRYSDDILVVCPDSMAADAEQFVKDRIAAEKLTVNDDKTERHHFDPSRVDHAQYLGFNLSPDGATIRQSSLSRQWRKMLKSVKRIKAAGVAAMAAGTADKIYTKTLRRRFTCLPVRNFSSYARRSADALDAPQIRRQIRRLERYVERELAAFPGSKP